MSQDGMKHLSDELLNYLQEPQLVILNTILEKDKPFVNAISWVYAKSADHIAFAVDNRSQMIVNIKANNQVAITVFYEQSLFTIYGKATIEEEQITGISLKLAKVKVEIESVQDVMFYGSKVSAVPQYEKTYNPEAAEKLDKQVFAALKA